MPQRLQVDGPLVAGQDNDRRFGRERAGALHGAQAMAVRQRQVQQDQVEAVAVEHGRRLGEALDVRELVRPRPRLRQQFGQQCRVAEVVFDQQDSDRCTHLGSERPLRASVVSKQGPVFQVLAEFLHPQGGELAGAIPAARAGLVSPKD